MSICLTNESLFTDYKSIKSLKALKKTFDRNNFE